MFSDQASFVSPFSSETTPFLRAERADVLRSGYCCLSRLLCSEAPRAGTYRLLINRKAGYFFKTIRLVTLILIQI